MPNFYTEGQMTYDEEAEQAEAERIVKANHEAAERGEDIAVELTESDIEAAMSMAMSKALPSTSHQVTGGANKVAQVIEAASYEPGDGIQGETTLYLQGGPFDGWRVKLNHVGPLPALFTYPDFERAHGLPQYSVLPFAAYERLMETTKYQFVGWKDK